MTEHDGLLIDVVVNGPFGENCHLVADAQTRQAWVVDPGFEPEVILSRVREAELKPELIVCTHGHIDHVGAVAPLQRTLGVPFAINPADQPWLENLPSQAAMFGLPQLDVPQPEQELTDGQTLQLGSHQAQVLFTPGHSAGGCCLYFAQEKVVLVGDTLFAQSIGRTDLPGGSMSTLLASIRDKLLSLDDDVAVYSGHGPATDIGMERRTNPFLNA